MFTISYEYSFIRANNTKPLLPVLYGVAASLDIGAARPGGEAGLGDLHGCLFVLDALLEQFDVLLHVEDLLQNLKWG